MTSAPRSASSIVVNAPASAIVRSRTRTPASGPNEGLRVTRSPQHPLRPAARQDPEDVRPARSEDGVGVLAEQRRGAGAGPIPRRRSATGARRRQVAGDRMGGGHPEPPGDEVVVLPATGADRSPRRPASLRACASRMATRAGRPAAHRANAALTVGIVDHELQSLLPATERSARRRRGPRPSDRRGRARSARW